MTAKKNQTTKTKTENDQDVELTKPKLDDRWVIEIEGNRFVKFAGLLDLGHQIGISQIEVEPLQLPTKENGNFAICRATVVSKTGESYSDLGDCHPGNCNSKVVKHSLRLASTRAIARSLRTFTNIGMTCLDELADISDVVGNGPKPGAKPKVETKPGKQPRKNAAVSNNKGKKASQQGKNSTRSKPTANKANGDNVNASVGDNSDNGGGRNNTLTTGNQPAMSQAQSNAITNIASRHGISDEDLEQLSLETYGVEVENLKNGDAASFIRQLQKAA